MARLGEGEGEGAGAGAGTLPLACPACGHLPLLQTLPYHHTAAVSSLQFFQSSVAAAFASLALFRGLGPDPAGLPPGSDTINALYHGALF